MSQTFIIRPFLSFFLLFSILIGAIPSFAVDAVKPNRCAALFSSADGLWKKTKSYSRDVVTSRGRLLFLKNFEPDGRETKWAGLLTKQEPDFQSRGISKYFGQLISYLPRKIGGLLARDQQYQFTPFSGLYNITMKNPVGYLSRKLSGTKFEPAFFFKIPLVLTLSVGVYLGADAVYQAKLQTHINTEITSHAVQYEQAIRSDYRYKKIKNALEKSEITQEEAHREAYFISLAYSQYFQYRDSQSSKPTLDSEMALLDHYLFSHLKPVIERGVTKASGYVVPKASLGPLSEPQIMRLFQNTHLRYLKYQIIIEMLKKSDLFIRIEANSQFSEIIKRIENDPFIRSLFGFHEKGHLTTEQLQIYLQEDIYWQSRFQDWETIGVTRLKVDGGQFSHEPLKIEDIRREILSEISSQT